VGTPQYFVEACSLASFRRGSGTTLLRKSQSCLLEWFDLLLDYRVRSDLGFWVLSFVYLFDSLSLFIQVVSSTPKRIGYLAFLGSDSWRILTLQIWNDWGSGKNGALK
jgi:hypothetical protein